MKHDSKENKLYAVYYGIKTRCEDVNHKDFPNYGARGIRNMFATYEDFEIWSLANGYKPGLQVDRIDNDGPYAPYNCRWVGRKKNCNNRGDTVKVCIGDETYSLTEWADVLGVPRDKFYKKIHKDGWPPEAVVKYYYDGGK